MHRGWNSQQSLGTVDRTPVENHIGPALTRVRAVLPQLSLLEVPVSGLTMSPLPPTCKSTHCHG